jgi:seryl-tRNA synthetase
MLDIAFIRGNRELVEQACKVKGVIADVPKLLEVDEQRRQLLGQVEEMRQQRNQLAAKGKKAKPTEEDIASGKELKEKIGLLETQLTKIEVEWRALLKQVPNIPYEDVPIGTSEDDNIVAKEWGEKPEFDFKPQNHWEIGEARGWIDKERAARVAGARFAYLKGDLVKLQFALMQYGIDQASDEKVLKTIAKQNDLDVSTKPFLPVLPPLLIRTAVYEATGRLNAEEQTYRLQDDDLWLNASAEHSLSPLHMDETLEETDLPLRYLGYSTSFRREAGTYGKDVEGIIRMHQFDKLEMESFSSPETSFIEHLFMIAIQEYVMQQLELPYRLINKCSADIGKPNARGWDIDAWLPGQGMYRETHTADYNTDYQARELHTRVRYKEDGRTELAHTNDATLLTQRPLIAIIENYQQKDGTVRVPAVLKSYLKKEILT